MPPAASVGVVGVFGRPNIPSFGLARSGGWRVGSVVFGVTFGPDGEPTRGEPGGGVVVDGFVVAGGGTFDGVAVDGGGRSPGRRARSMSAGLVTIGGACGMRTAGGGRFGLVLTTGGGVVVGAVRTTGGGDCGGGVVRTTGGGALRTTGGGVVLGCWTTGGGVPRGCWTTGGRWMFWRSGGATPRCGAPCGLCPCGWSGRRPLCSSVFFFCCSAVWAYAGVGSMADDRAQAAAPSIKAVVNALLVGRDAGMVSSLGFIGGSLRCTPRDRDSLQDYRSDDATYKESGKASG